MTKHLHSRWKYELLLFVALVLCIFSIMGAAGAAFVTIGVLIDKEASAWWVFMSVPVAVVLARVAYLCRGYVGEQWNLRKRKW